MQVKRKLNNVIVKNILQETKREENYTALEVIQRFLEQKVIPKLPKRYFKFIPNFTILQETGVKLDYTTSKSRELFNNLSCNIASDFARITDIVFYSLDIPTKKDVFYKEFEFINSTLDGLSVNVIIKCQKGFYHPTPSYNKGALIVSISTNKYEEIPHILQVVYISNINLDIKQRVKNGIFNLLFHIYIVLEQFKYNAMFHRVYHMDDLSKLLNYTALTMKHFKVDQEECSVCYEYCVNKTMCNHSLCLRCISKLVKPECPMCKRYFLEDDMDMEEYA